MRNSVLLLSLVSVASLGLLAPASAHDRARTPVRIPDIAGYKTLKCDFHIHTVFSDGKVWPDVRSEEAWRHGLDAIAITDHLEYQPHKKDLPTNHNRSYEIAKPLGDDLEVIVVKGSEITRKMPPGHMNAIFLTDSEPLATDSWTNAVQAAKAQGAFIFWNHPGWTGQQPDGKARWYAEHGWLLEQGFMNGLEVVNERDYYPEAHQWALEKNLTMLSNSDIHAPLNLEYDVHDGDHRPITLVFARERTPEGIKEALFARRTAVYNGNVLVGKEEFLQPIFAGSVRVVSAPQQLKPKGRALVQIQNESDLRYELELEGAIEGLTLPATLSLAPGKTVLCEVRAGQKVPSLNSVRARFRVTNLLIAPGKPLVTELVLPLRAAE